MSDSGRIPPVRVEIPGERSIFSAVSVIMASPFLIGLGWIIWHSAQVDRYRDIPPFAVIFVAISAVVSIHTFAMFRAKVWVEDGVVVSRYLRDKSFPIQEIAGVGYSLYVSHRGQGTSLLLVLADRPPVRNPGFTQRGAPSVCHAIQDEAARIGLPRPPYVGGYRGDQPLVPGPELRL